MVPGKDVLLEGAAVLPQWETTPSDLPKAVREVKKAIRANIEASGRTVEEVLAVVEGRLQQMLHGTPNPVHHWKPLFD